MNKQKRKTHLFEIDRAARTARRTKPYTVKQIHITEKRSTGEKIRRNHQYETTLEDAETRQVLMQAAQSFIGTIEFYKSEIGEETIGTAGDFAEPLLVESACRWI